jgi:hypothetical protein
MEDFKFKLTRVDKRNLVFLRDAMGAHSLAEVLRHLITEAAAKAEARANA